MKCVAKYTRLSLLRGSTRLRLTTPCGKPLTLLVHCNFEIAKHRISGILQQLTSGYIEARGCSCISVLQRQTRSQNIRHKVENLISLHQALIEWRTQIFCIWKYFCRIIRLFLSRCSDFASQSGVFIATILRKPDDNKMKWL